MPTFDVALMGLVYVEVEVNSEGEALEEALRKIRKDLNTYAARASWVLNELEDEPVRREGKGGNW